MFALINYEADKSKYY